MARLLRPAASILLAFGLTIATTPLRTAAAETLEFRAALKGANETPPNDSPATGMVGLQYDTISRVLSWTVTYSGLSGPAMTAQFHGPADPGTAAPVLLPVRGDLDSPINGQARLDAQQARALQTGQMYFNIHTTHYPAGEIRGQVISSSK